MGTPVKGYASVFGNLDRKDEIIAPGAYADFLAANPGIQVPLLWYHNLADVTGLPIGMTTDIREDGAGLLFEGELADTRLGRDLAALLELSDMGTSLHYFDGAGTMDTETGVITVERASFSEFSFLTPGDQANLLATAGLADSFQSEAAEVAGALAAIRETFQAVA
jgi:HK97 family phage prohead protease